MKVKNTFKSIFLKTAAMFFTFYFIVVIVFTGIYYKSNIDENNAKFNYMQSFIQDKVSNKVDSIEYDRLIDGRNGFWRNDANTLNKDLNDLAELNGELSHDTSSFGNEMLSKAYLYDENCKKIAYSRNLLWIGREETKKSDNDHHYVSRYVDLDKYFSEDEEIELFKLQNPENNTQAYLIKVQGYINGAEIIPDIIEIYKMDGPVSAERGLKGAEKIKTYNFNVQGVDGLRKIEIEDYFNPNWEVNYSENIDGNLYKKTFERYYNLREYSEEEIRSLIDDKTGYIHARNNIYNSLVKVNYNYINTLNIKNHKYFVVLKADYYPWEDILPKAIPLYLISFIMVLAMTLILSKGLYKTYEKQGNLEKNRRELTSAIAHELKTPLGIIRTYGEGLKEKIAEDKRDKYLDVIIDETYKMDKMVLEMLELSKLEAKAYELKRESFCINYLVEAIIKKNEKVFNDKSINANYTSDKKYDIDADYTRIEQVIDNFLSNAIYHTDENKSINIKLNNGKFIIENEGEHISKDKINLIWDTFYRVDVSRDRSERRTGIGLAIVKNVLQLHDFKFGVENTTIGVKFWFEF